MAQHSFKNSTINGRAKGGKKTRNCGRADGERRKKLIDKHLKLCLCLVPFYFTKIIKINYKKIVEKKQIVFNFRRKSDGLYKTW